MNQRLRRCSAPWLPSATRCPAFWPWRRERAGRKTATGGPLHRSGSVPRRRAALAPRTPSVPPTRSPTSPHRQNPAPAGSRSRRAAWDIVPPHPGPVDPSHSGGGRSHCRSTAPAPERGTLRRKPSASRRHREATHWRTPGSSRFSLFSRCTSGGQTHPPGHGTVCGTS